MARIDKDERREKTMRAAQKELAKSGNLQIRIEEAILNRVYELANKKGIRYTTMVRDWIVEKLDDDTLPSTRPDQGTLNMINLLLQNISEMNQRIHALENEVRGKGSAKPWAPVAAEGKGVNYGVVKESPTDTK